SLLALDMTAVPAWVQGAATVVRAQLALSSDPAVASSLATDGLKLCREAGDGWNEGYALGTRAAIAAQRGKLREAEQLATSSVAVMRRIDQQWGAARGLLGLGDLARFRNRPGEAHGWYVEALAILREIGARP